MIKQNKLLISSIVAIIALVIIAFGSSKNNTIFYLEDKYYNTGEKIELNSEDINSLSNESFLLFTYNNFCGMAKPCEEVFDSVLKEYKLDYISIPVEEFRKTKYHETVKIAPSFIIVNKGKIVAYLDAEKDDHIKYYQNEKDFEKWLESHIYMKK